jgi:hypothetical protein
LSGAAWSSRTGWHVLATWSSRLGRLLLIASGQRRLVVLFWSSCCWFRAPGAWLLVFAIFMLRLSSCRLDLDVGAARLACPRGYAVLPSCRLDFLCWYRASRLSSWLRRLAVLILMLVPRASCLPSRRLGLDVMALHLVAVALPS